MTKTITLAAALLGLLTAGCGLATENDSAGNGRGDGRGNASAEPGASGAKHIAERDGRGRASDCDEDDGCIVEVTESGAGGANEGGTGGTGGTGGAGGAGGEPPCDGDDCGQGGGDGGCEGNDCDEPEIVCYEVAGNPTCEGLALGVELVRIDPPESGTYAAGAATFTIAADGGMLDFDTTVAVDAVILKAGNGAMVCTFSEKVSAATDLAGPENPNNGQLYDLSHVDFCAD